MTRKMFALSCSAAILLLAARPAVSAPLVNASKLPQPRRTTAP